MRSRLQKGRRSLAVLATALSFCWLGANAALAACPTVADPGKLVGAFPEQAEIEEAAAAGLTLTYTDNPLFAADVAANKLPPVKDRLPEQPLIELPYDSCGVYGGTIEGTSRAPTSGTSDILS